MPAERTMLVTLTGRDRPGVTSALFRALSRHDVEVVDVEQVLIRGRLVLGVLLTSGPDDAGLVASVQRAAAELEMDVETSAGSLDEVRRPNPRSHVSVIGNPLRPVALAALAGRIADRGANIERIVRLARYPVTGIEMEVSGIQTELLRTLLSAEAAVQGVDVAVQRSGLLRRAKRLVVMDVDSTLVQGEVIEVLAHHAGCAAEVARLTEEAMRGDVEFADSLRARVALIAGLPVSVLDEVRRAVRLAPGARTLVRTLKRLDHKFAIVSGGFTQITDRLVADLAIDYSAANTLEVLDGRLTGRLEGPVIDRAGKAAALARFAADAGIPMSQTVAIGDGANDLDMLALAGLGIAFNAKPLVREAADAALNVPYLDTILYLLGISRDEIEAADEEAGTPTPAPPLER